MSANRNGKKKTVRDCKKIVFLDRDGIVNKKAAEHCYVTKIEDFVFNRGIFELLNGLKNKGFEFIILTNQRGIARGHFSEEDLNDVHKYMLEHFERNGIKILDVFYCPHEEGVCRCRKPNPGMLEAACKKYNIDLNMSMLISDNNEDVDMGIKFGIAKCIFMQTDSLNPAKCEL